MPTGTELSALSDIERFIVRELPKHPGDIARVASEHFGITRQAVGRHLRRLVSRGVLMSSGETRAREYQFAVLAQTRLWLPISSDLQEDLVWRDHIAPLLVGVPENVVDICRYGVTEIINNAVDHSGSEHVGITATYKASDIGFLVLDEGVGIFRKIKEGCRLEDERHAILELAKGKLTTDPERHTGEGIFFTSRMFDSFGILSGHLYVSCSRERDDWLLEDRDHPMNGTSVHMAINPFSSHTTREVFDRYAVEQDDYAFSRTHIVVALAQQAHGEKLVSRSQAKRVMARLERFMEVVLDFNRVDEIGPAFADEIFRVFQRQHPGTRLTPINTGDGVARMIRRAIAASSERDSDAVEEKR